MDLETLYREERPRALATLIRLLRDFDLAEDMLQEAFAAAVEQWPRRRRARNPCAWLVSTAAAQGDRPPAARARPSRPSRPRSRT
jgi:RNA polymerase sigma-70 factor (ECF subfamily)